MDVPSFARSSRCLHEWPSRPALSLGSNDQFKFGNVVVTHETDDVDASLVEIEAVELDRHVHTASLAREQTGGVDREGTGLSCDDRASGGGSR